MGDDWYEWLREHEQAAADGNSAADAGV